MEYKHETFTYDANGNLTDDLLEYWNRNKQDWSGNDKYNNFIENNYRIAYTYDEENRCLKKEIFDIKYDGSLKLSYLVENEYETLDDGNLLKKESEYISWKNTGKPELSKVIEQTFNSFGYEIHYLNSSYTIIPDVRINKIEEFRHYDELGRFTGAEYYAFKWQEDDNSRYGEIKEAYFYDDPDPRAGYTEGHHYLGTSYDSDEAWVMSNSFYYQWENGVLISRVAKTPTENGEIRNNGYDIEYDFEADMNNVIWWSSISLGDEFENNKTLSVTQYRNLSSEDKWDPGRSFKDVYFYSEFSSTSLSNNIESLSDIESNNTRVEVARYNVSGTRLNAPAKGINIIKYSDGSVVKEIL